jgi:hypothetical protein
MSLRPLAAADSRGNPNPWPAGAAAVEVSSLGLDEGAKGGGWGVANVRQSLVANLGHLVAGAPQPAALATHPPVSHLKQ